MPLAVSGAAGFLVGVGGPRSAASSGPGPYSGSTKTGVTQAAWARPPGPPMALDFVPLQEEEPSASTARDLQETSADTDAAQVTLTPRGRVRTLVPPMGRLVRLFPRTCDSSPKRGPASPRAATVSAAPPTVLTLESLAIIVYAGFKGVDGKLVKILRSVDGLSSVVWTAADEYSNMAVLAESVTTAQGVTATALAVIAGLQRLRRNRRRGRAR